MLHECLYLADYLLTSVFDSPDCGLAECGLPPEFLIPLAEGVDALLSAQDTRQEKVRQSFYQTFFSEVSTMKACDVSDLKRKKF
jgi:hypothetical protein